MTITFVDAGVLIAAARGTTEVSARAMVILDDPARSFASSEFIRLEVLPKAVFNGKTNEAEFYRKFFDAVAHWPGKHRCGCETCVRDRSQIRNGCARCAPHRRGPI